MQDFGGPSDEATASTAPLQWRKSAHSNPNGSCVELAPVTGRRIAMRNSRHPDGEMLVHTAEQLQDFLLGVQRGEFDDLAVDGHPGLQ